MKRGDMRRKPQTLQQIIDINCYDAILHYEGWGNMEKVVRKENPQNLADAILARLARKHEYLDLIELFELHRG